MYLYIRNGEEFVIESDRQVKTIKVERGKMKINTRNKGLKHLWVKLWIKMDEEKEHKAEIRKLKEMTRCKVCNFKTDGVSLKEGVKLVQEHIKKKHPELRPYKL